jgi:trafficking protein particle complex subunit 13
MLPSSFGTIQLGETFSSTLCVNNDSGFDVEAVSLLVEMQTVTAKVVLADFGGSDYILRRGDTLESLVNHEIKELGQHVLACTVSYRLPPQARRGPPPASPEGTDPTIQNFRKFYKFAVSTHHLFQLIRSHKHQGYQSTSRQDEGSHSQSTFSSNITAGEG